MQFNIKKWQVALFAIVVILIILNPSKKNFVEFTGDPYYITREHNFIICSVFKQGDGKYLGIGLNFFKLPNTPAAPQAPIRSNDKNKIGDTNKMASDTGLQQNSKWPKALKIADTIRLDDEGLPIPPGFQTSDGLPILHKVPTASSVLNSFYRIKRVDRSIVLDQKYRLVLDTVVGQLIQSGESDAVIRFLINDFKLKYGKKLTAGR